MTRIRWALAALAIAIAVPTGLLVARALESAAVEREVRHRAVAERVFDEMERVLTRFLESEEARPFEAYRFYETLDAPDDAASGRAPERTRSPLSRPAPERFVVGHFQVDPDGSLHTPLRPRDPTAAVERGDWPGAQGAEQRARAVEQRVGPFWARAARRDLAAARRSGRRPDVVEAKAGLVGKDASGRLQVADAPAADDLADLDADEGKSTAYELLQSFNLGAETRAARKQKITEAPREVIYGQAALEEAPGAVRARPARSLEALSDPETDRAERSRAPTTGAATTAYKRALEKGESGSAAAERAFAERMPSQPSERTEPEESEQTVRVVLDPMVGHPLDANGEMLLLYRTVVVDEQGYRQGVVVDRRALAEHLRNEVLWSGPLVRQAAAHFTGPDLAGGRAPEVGASYAFSHRFAEPFDALGVWLTLAPLAEGGGEGTLYALCALLFVVTGAGLLAVHRMVGVVVEYADRRNNFVAAVSHELKTPLTAIRMYAEMLRDGLVGDRDKQSEYYRTITDESERLSRLIDNVLEFSRLEKGRRELSVAVGSLGPVLAEALQKLRPHCEREGFELRAEIEDGLPTVRFDRDALLQVLFNLVDNAVKYGRASERREIVVRCARAAPYDGVELSVRDFGPGVSRRQLERIFEPFYRGETELTRNTRGTGIGLALVRELAQAMGARVEGDSPEDGGFCVTLTLEAAA